MIGSRKGQTFIANSVVTHNAELPFEHLPYPLAKRELIDLRFDRRLLAAQQAFHKPSVAGYCACDQNWKVLAVTKLSMIPSMAY